MDRPGLRELKKERTRQDIARVAREMFRSHGYDPVTVEAIAQAAEVSKKTVFNYFPTKEDLVFYQADDRRAAVLAAVNDRAPGQSVLESFRALCLAQTEALPRFRESARLGGLGFYELVEANPALQRKAREVTASLVDALAEALAASAGRAGPDSTAVIVATTLVTTQRTLQRRLRELAGTELTDATVLRRHEREVNQVFDQLRDGLAGYPTRSGA
jgi:AcrR family transcriptional regulator